VPTATTPKTRPADRSDKSTPIRLVLQQISPLQVKMNEVLERICDVQASDGRKLSTLFQKLPSKAEYPVSNSINALSNSIHRTTTISSGNRWTWRVSA
jgi:hypothetical protein